MAHRKQTDWAQMDRKRFMALYLLGSVLLLVCHSVSPVQCQTSSSHEPTRGGVNCAGSGKPSPQPGSNPDSSNERQLRQQRQFSGARIVDRTAAKLLALVETEQEDFSLGSNTVGQGDQRQQRQQKPQLQANSSQPEEQPSSGSSEPPSSTENQAALNTTPAQPVDSISSPVALAPPTVATTSSSLASELPGRVNQAANSVQSESSTVNQNQSLPGARRLELDPLLGSSAGQVQPVSSSPSSISIITPLIGSAQQAAGSQVASMEQQPHSMMKPILVLGNPISEHDYHNQQVPGAYQAGNFETASKTPRLVDQKSLKLGPSGQTGEPVSTMASTVPDEPMTGPPLAYSDGQLGSALPEHHHLQPMTPQVQPIPMPQPPPQPHQAESSAAPASSGGQQQHTPRLFQSPMPASMISSPRRPSLPPAVNQANAASGARSPLSPSGPLVGTGGPTLMPAGQPTLVLPPANTMVSGPLFYQSVPPYAGPNLFGGAQIIPQQSQQQPQHQQQQQPQQQLHHHQHHQHHQQQQQQQLPPQQAGYNKQAQVMPQSNGLSVANSQMPQVPSPAPGTAPGIGYSGRRPLNITRVEHISAECSNDLIRAVIVFNGTFKGIIYSSGYVSDPTCLYVNGTGSTRYEFNIRLNQCGTLGRQELHQPTIPGEARRRDQVMWNTLSIQYNSIIEQEWDEHFRVSCEYGSDFWKTVSFSPFNVETNTGSPVVFTINPPQCQMDVLLGHGMGPKIAVDGPVTVGDPLTLLIHMKSEKAGYDILVKNCVAHNGGKQRMQLIDSNGCVVNERFISPFRGTYNDNDLRHVTLYAYLKAFRFTGSPVLYLECEIHMCQSACPPQMCYWRRLSKRSVSNSDYEYTNATGNGLTETASEIPVISDSLNLFKALQVRHGPEAGQQSRDRRPEIREIRSEDEEASLICYRQTEVYIYLVTVLSLLALVISVAITCCLRVRKLSGRNQFQHCKLQQKARSSLSPSILSIGDTYSMGSTSSLIGTQPADCAKLVPGSWCHHRTEKSYPIANSKLYRSRIVPAHFTSAIPPHASNLTQGQTGRSSHPWYTHVTR